MKKFFESQYRFSRIDGDNFGGCMQQLSNGSLLIEWRIRKKDNKVCLIQYYPNGEGYQIYEPEQNKK